MKRFLLLMAVLMIPGVGALGAATTEGRAGLLPLGSPMPDFNLTDVVSGRTVSSQGLEPKKVTMVAFICRHCPYAQHVKKSLAQLGRDYADKDVAIVTISSNDPAAYPDDAPESLKEMAQEAGFNFPLLFDESQKTAQSFTAIATPDIFIFDSNRKLVYRGQFDDTRPNSGGEATGKDVREAIDRVLSGKSVSTRQKPAIGCSIKWIPGNAPAYAR